MKLFRGEIGKKTIAFLAWLTAQIIGRTCRFTVVGYETPRKMMKAGKGFIFAIWHGRTLMPVFYCRGLGIWAITSLSRDGDIQTQIVSRFGFQCIRGSSRKGAIKAALMAAKKLEEGGILAITPDGPLGPYHEVQEGTIFLAQRANVPVIPVGVGISRRKVLPAWDKYAFPLPFAKVALIFGDPIHISEDSDPPPAEIIKNALNDLEAQAQAMAGEEVPD